MICVFYYERTKGLKHEKKEKFRAHAAQAPALRVPIFACPVKLFFLFNRGAFVINPFVSGLSGLGYPHGKHRVPAHRNYSFPP
jgi:hypothetical protein